MIPPRAPSAGSVTAMRIVKSDDGTLDTQILRPLMTQWSPSRTARVRMAAGSLPAPGSEIAIADLALPWA